MTDFAKTKITFALAMVGVLFAIHPVVKEFWNIGFDFFSLILELKYLYITIMALMSTSVYFYAFEFITDRQMGFSHKMGNILYTVSLLILPLYIVLWVTSILAAIIGSIFESYYTENIVEFGLAILSGVAGVIIVELSTRLLNKKDRLSNVDQLVTQEGKHLMRAEDMLNSSHYDLAALEAFRSIEIALERALVDSNVSFHSKKFQDLISKAIKVGVLHENNAGMINEVRIARNNAVHGKRTISKDEAEWLIRATKEILGSIKVSRNLKDE